MPYLRLVLALLLPFAAALPAHAANTPLPIEQIRIDELMNDTQKTGGGIESSEMVWWLPPQLWAYVLAKQEGAGGKHDKSASQAVSKQFQDLFTRHTVVAVLRISDNNSLNPEFSSETELRSQLRLVDMHGESHTPVAADKVDPELSAILKVMRPVLTGLIGPAGENMQFYVFPGRGKAGPVADALADGKMRVMLGRNEFVFRLPLGALLPARRDPGNGETFPGNYRYNPYTGSPLEAVGGGR